MQVILYQRPVAVTKHHNVTSTCESHHFVWLLILYVNFSPFITTVMWPLKVMNIVKGYWTTHWGKCSRSLILALIRKYRWSRHRLDQWRCAEIPEYVFNKTTFQFIDIPYWFLLNRFKHHHHWNMTPHMIFPYTVIHWIEVATVERPRVWSDEGHMTVVMKGLKFMMKSGVSCRNRSTVSRFRCAGALSTVHCYG